MNRRLFRGRKTTGIRTDIRTGNAVEGSEKRQALILQELVEIRKLLEKLVERTEPPKSNDRQRI